MIDRKTLWTLLLLCLVVTAAAFWRLSLLPDWTRVPFTVGRNGPHVEHGLVLFVPTFSLLFMIALALGTRWLVSGSEDAIQAHKRRNRLMLMGTGAMAALMQAFVIGRSLDYGNSLDGDAIARGVMVVTAILMMLHGNSMPKLPWITSRFPAFQLDPWQSARLKRFAGRMSIAYGLAIVAAAVLLPVKGVALTVFLLMPVHMGSLIWYALRLRREGGTPGMTLERAQ